MKTFRWIKLKSFEYRPGTIIHTLFDMSKIDQFLVTACGTVYPEDNQYFAVVTNPITQQKSRILEPLSLEEAKLQIEKKLMEYGVIGEGDIVEE